MKKVLSMMALSAFIFAGCQEDLETLQEGAGEESVVRITLQAPDAMGMTRAGAGYTNSANGGLTNVDWTQYDLRYQIAVYDAKGTVQIVSPQTLIVKDASDISASFEVRLVNNRTYKFVAWADFVNEGSRADLHYNTSDLTNIVCLDKEEAQLNDESRDAYFVTTNEKVNSKTGVSLTLRRPFAKVRLVTTDWNPSDPDRRPNEIKITYYGCQRFTGLNAVTGVATGSKLSGWSTATTYTATIDPDEKDYSGGYDGGEENGPAEGAVDAGGEEETSSTTGNEKPSAGDCENRTLMVDYLIASPEQTTIKFRYQAFQDNKKVSAYLFKTEIPIQRNYLTTLLGNMLTEGINVTMTCEEDFEEGINDPSTDITITGEEPTRTGNTYLIENAAHLVWISEKANSNMGTNFPYVDGGYTFKLVNDIDMTGVDWTPIRWIPNDNDGKSAGTFDGDGHTIRNLTIDAAPASSSAIGSGNAGLFGYAGSISIKNLTLENVTINRINDTGFAGAIAGDLYGDIENCHVKHVFIRATNYYKPIYPGTESTGGMLGNHNQGSMKNCSAEDVDVKGNSSVGALVGRMSGGGSKNTDERKYQNCTVKNSSMWITITEEVSYSNTPIATHVGSVIGAIFDNEAKSISFENMTITDCEYKVGIYDIDEGLPYIFYGVNKDGDEDMSNDKGPQYDYFGNLGYDTLSWNEETKTVSVSKKNP